MIFTQACHCLIDISHLLRVTKRKDHVVEHISGSKQVSYITIRKASLHVSVWLYEQTWIILLLCKTILNLIYDIHVALGSTIKSGISASSEFALLSLCKHNFSAQSEYMIVHSYSCFCFLFFCFLFFCILIKIYRIQYILNYHTLWLMYWLLCIMYIILKDHRYYHRYHL